MLCDGENFYACGPPPPLGEFRPSGRGSGSQGAGVGPRTGPLHTGRGASSLACKQCITTLEEATPQQSGAPKHCPLYYQYSQSEAAAGG